MTKAEVAKLFELIVYFYPAFTGDRAKVESWHECLESMPFDLAKENLRRHSTTEKFPPTIAEIRAGYSDPGTSNVPSAEETRNTVYKALEESRERAIPMPESFREELKRIAKRREHSAS